MIIWLHLDSREWRYQRDARDERDESYADQLEDVDPEDEERQLVEGVGPAVVEDDDGKTQEPLEDVVGDRVDVRQEHDGRWHGVPAGEYRWYDLV